MHSTSGRLRDLDAGIRRASVTRDGRDVAFELVTNDEAKAVVLRTPETNYFAIGVERMAVLMGEAGFTRVRRIDGCPSSPCSLAHDRCARQAGTSAEGALDSIIRSSRAPRKRVAHQIKNNRRPIEASLGAEEDRAVTGHVRRLIGFSANALGTALQAAIHN